MNIEELREYCLSFDGVTEKTPFGKFAARFDSVLVFYVCDHMFGMFDIDDFTGITVKGQPDRVADMLETRASCLSHRNMSKKYWIQLNFGGDISDAEIFDMVRQSYEIVKASHSKKK